MLPGALADDHALARTSPTAVIPSFSVSAKTRVVRTHGTRLLLITSVTVTGVSRSISLGISCSNCRRVRHTKIYRTTTATSRRYSSLYWLLPRGRGISIKAIEAGRLGRWTILAPGRRHPTRLVFKASGCLRQVTPASVKRLRRVACPPGTAITPLDSPVPVTPAVPEPPPPATPATPATPAPVVPKPPPPPPPPPSQICCETALRGASNEKLLSTDGRFELRMQNDGNLVLYSRLSTPYHALWNARTDGSGADRAVMQGDGNLVVYRGGTAVWASNTGGFGGATLVMQNDGNAVIYQGGVARWASGTGGRT